MSTGRMPCAFNSRTREPSIDGGRPLYTPAAFCLGNAFQLPLAAKLVANSANMPSISRKHLPAAGPVSAAPWPSGLRREPGPSERCPAGRPMLLAKRSIRVTIRTSPACRDFSTVRSAFAAFGRGAARFSARMT
jgi:hypothetical protein